MCHQRTAASLETKRRSRAGPRRRAADPRFERARTARDPGARHARGVVGADDEHIGLAVELADRQAQLVGPRHQLIGDRARRVPAEVHDAKAGGPIPARQAAPLDGLRDLVDEPFGALLQRFAGHDDVFQGARGRFLSLVADWRSLGPCGPGAEEDQRRNQSQAPVHVEASGFPGSTLPAFREESRRRRTPVVREPELSGRRRPRRRPWPCPARWGSSPPRSPP